MRSLTCDHHDLRKDGLARCFRLQINKKKHENLEASACQLSFLPVGYLWFFDQLQQVFNMLSQQILALPHLIQSSERIKIKGFSSDAHRSTIVIVLGHDT